MIRLRSSLAKLLLCSLACLSAGAAWAKGGGSGSAQDYFHGSAYKYVAGRQQEALIQAEEGLSRFPDDAALKGLVAHLRKLKDQQKQDQGSQGSSQGDQGKQDQDRKKDDSKGGGGEDQQDKKDEKEQKPQDGQEDKGQEGKDGQGQESEGKDGKDSSGEAMAPVKPGEMSKEDADRLLNSIQDDEKKEHRQQQRRYRKRPEVEQDW